MIPSGGKPRKILIVSFQYWPALNARAFRWTELAEDWVRKGLQVHVVCSRLSDRPTFETVNGVQVHRVGTWIETQRGGGGRGISCKSGKMRVSRWLSGIAGRSARAAWRQVHWPDTCCTWFFAARRKSQEVVEALDPDAVVSVSPAFSAVAVGYSLARGIPRAYRWIIDIGDPFSFAEEAPPNNFRLYRKLNLLFERKCFATADAVTVTNSATRDRYAAIFPESSGKIEIIPPLISLPRVDVESRRGTQSARKLVFLGRLYASIRRPDSLLALFAAFIGSQGGHAYELHFFGESGECAESFERYRMLLDRSVFVHGPVSRTRAAEEMHSAYALVNIGNTTGYQLPSKVVEYAASGKPVLNVAAVPNDSSSRFLADYPAHLTLTSRAADPSVEDVRRLGEFLNRAPERVPEQELVEWLAPYNVSAVSSRYLALCSGRSPARPVRR